MVRQALLDAIPTERVRSWAIIDMSLPVQIVARSPTAAIQAASAATGQVCVVALHEVAEQALSRFRLVAQTTAAMTAEGGSVADIAAARVTRTAGSNGA